MGQNPKCSGYFQRLFISELSDIIKKINKETSQDISPTCITSTTIAGAGQHSLYTCQPSTCTEDVSLSTKFRFNVGPASQPIACSMLVNRLRRWPNANPSLCANTWHSPNAVSMLIHSLRRWLEIETASGDCTVFSDCCMRMWVTLPTPAPETPDNTIY